MELNVKLVKIVLGRLFENILFLIPHMHLFNRICSCSVSLCGDHPEDGCAEAETSRKHIKK
jgi:hypothetical protein